MWLKLLFVPTLGIIILTLFLLEEYCYAHDHHPTTAPHDSIQSGASQSTIGSAAASLPQLTGGNLSKDARALVNVTTTTTNGLVSGTCKDSALSGPSMQLTPQTLNSTFVTTPPTGKYLTSPTTQITLTGSQYAHPLTLLSPTRTPQPSIDYPLLNAAPLAAAVAGTTTLHNPQDLLAAQGRAVRHAALLTQSMTTQQTQIALMGHAASFTPMPSNQPHAFRINIMNEAGMSCILVATPATTLRELFTHYAARNNAACWLGGSTAPSSGTAPQLHHSVYKFTYRGQSLTNEKATLASIGLPSATSDTALECEVIHVELDFEQLYQQFLQETAKEEEYLAEKLAQELDTLLATQQKWKELSTAVEKANDLDKDLQDQVKKATEAKQAAVTKLESIKQGLASEQTAVQQARRDKLTAEGTDAERVEHKRLEKMKHGLNRELDTLNSELAELAAKQARLEKERTTLIKESGIVREKTLALEEEATKLAYYAIDEAASNPSSATDKTNSTPLPPSSAELPNGFVPLGILTQQLEHLERQFMELQTQKKKVDFITNEIAHKRSEVHSLAKKVQMSAGLNATAEDGTLGATTTSGANPTPSSNGPQSKLDALPSLRARALQLEKDTKDLLKWKSIAKHLEMEGKENFRWKSLLRAALTREKYLESQMSDLTNYRTRAKAFEKEVRELRQWKRKLSGLDATQPPATAGDFYASPAAAAAAGAGLGLGLAYDNDPILLDGVDDGYDDGERIEPQPQYARSVAAEEEANAAALASSNTKLSSDERDRSGHGERMSDELYAAEMEEERLVTAMRRDSVNGNSLRNGSSANGGVDADEELFKLGEALVRRNQHLHQHRLILRYQQQQQMAMMMQQQQQQQADLMQQHHPQDGLSAAAAMQQQIYTGKTVPTGVLQASAPVFTPRYQTDTVVQPGPLTATSPTAKLSSHYTKAPINYGTNVHSPMTETTLTPTSASLSTLSWNSPNMTATAGPNNSALDLDPSAYWNSSLQSLLDEMDSSQASTNSSANSHSTRVRERSFSNPSQQPSSILPNSSANLPVVTSMTPQAPPSSGFGLSSGGGGLDPFTAFRRQQNLMIIDDDDDTTTDQQQHQQLRNDNFNLTQPFSLDSTTPFHSFSSTAGVDSLGGLEPTSSSGATTASYGGPNTPARRSPTLFGTGSTTLPPPSFFTLTGAPTNNN